MKEEISWTFYQQETLHPCSCVYYLTCEENTLIKVKVADSKLILTPKVFFMLKSKSPRQQSPKQQLPYYY